MKRLLPIVLLLVCLLVSCRTTETVVEYVPVELDVETLIKPIIQLRPADVILITNPETLSDIMQNSVAFQYAYQNWRDYAVTLENFYLELNKAQGL